MARDLDDLWADRTQARAPFRSAEAPVFLHHALADGVRPATAVRLTMHGEIRIQGWKPFRAKEVIHCRRGFVWRARVGRLISGGDALVDGTAWGRWNLLGVIPLARASGENIVRSATGRWLCEAIWLPSMLLPSAGARWEGDEVSLERLGHEVTLQLGLEADGRLRDLRTRRWGNPDGGEFGEHAFGAIMESERTFEGYTIPSRVRVGWHIGTDRWQTGEFFRATVDSAAFR